MKDTSDPRDCGLEKQPDKRTTDCGTSVCTKGSEMRRLVGIDMNIINAQLVQPLTRCARVSFSEAVGGDKDSGTDTAKKLYFHIAQLGRILHEIPQVGACT